LRALVLYGRRFSLVCAKYSLAMFSNWSLT
jgi:hypothetical protein